MKKLPVNELLLLGELDGRVEVSADTRAEKLIAKGYLVIEKRLDSLTIPELKEILRRNNQKLSGNKAELIKRIVENVPAENYADNLPNTYVATDKGRLELSERYAYIENQKMQYGFLNSEIAELEGKMTSDKILEERFLRDITKHGAAKNYGLLRNTYYNLGQYFRKRGRTEEYLRSLLSVIYYDLSGAGNNNSRCDYATMDCVFETSVWKEIDKARTELNLTDEGLNKLFDEAVEISVKVPFPYFDTSIMKKMILGRLRGETNLLQRYSPIERQSAYQIAEVKPKKNYKVWLSVAAAVFLCFVLAGFMKVEKPAPIKDDTIEISAPKRIEFAQDTNDKLHYFFTTISEYITEQKLQKYIELDKLEYTKESSAPTKQTTYKIAYKKSDTYHTRSTGGDYVQVTFDDKTGKFQNVTYYNAKASAEVFMTVGVLRGHKEQYAGSKYYFTDSYKGLDGAQFCPSAQFALNMLKARL